MKYLRKFNSLTDRQSYLNNCIIPDIPFVHFLSDEQEVLYCEDEFNSSNYPLYIKANGNGTIKFSNTCEYSMDNKSWTSAESNTNIQVSEGQIVFFRASDLTASSSGIGTFSSSIFYTVGGNVMSMIYGKDFIGKTEIAQDSNLRNLFRNSNGLVNASSLILPATELTSYCYSGMFYGCTALKYAPKLPAITLSVRCYSEMFYHCTSLIEAPDLPATKLNTSCYSDMFNYCTSLIKAPIMNFTTCESNCCFQMFYSCKSLQHAPKLPATTLASSCYSSMFRECHSLISAPELPATIAELQCYNRMFENCISLVNAPKIHIIKFAQSGGCISMFEGCKSLINAPELNAQNLSYECYKYMFKGCISLATAPKLPSTKFASDCYFGMFSGTNVLPDCSNIDFTSKTIVTYGVLRGLFSGTIVTDDDLKVLLPKDENGDYCLPLESLNSYGCYESMFSSCKNLITAPKLKATKLSSTCYSYMFSGCTSLINAPELPNMELNSSCYRGMFYGCTNLTIAPELPATTLTSHCYSEMFKGCTSLISAPILPATNLTEGCYSHMFHNCESLNYIKMLATDISASDCLYRWVDDVAPAGTFVKNSSATWDVLGDNGIPEGWTIEYADA